MPCGGNVLSAATVAMARVVASVFEGLWHSTQYSVLLRRLPCSDRETWQALQLASATTDAVSSGGSCRNGVGERICARAARTTARLQSAFGHITGSGSRPESGVAIVGCWAGHGELQGGSLRQRDVDALIILQREGDGRVLPRRGIGHAGNGKTEAGDLRIRVLGVQSRCVGGHHVRAHNGGIENLLILGHVAGGTLRVIRL